jgi:hypothetical protein
MEKEPLIPTAVGLIAGLDVSEKKKLSCPCLESG